MAGENASRESRLAELAARKAERAATAETEANARAADFELADAEAIDKAEIEHGVEGKYIAVVRTEVGCVIVRRPSSAAYQRFVDSGMEKTKDVEALVKSCRVHPDVAEFARILSEQPGVLMHVADAAIALAGFKREEVRGKL